MFKSDERRPAATTAGTTLIIEPKKMWPVMVLRGALALLFGIAALAWPGITVFVLALLFAVYAPS